MTGAIEFSGMGLAKSGRAILRDLDGRIEPGRVTVILGPNGAGKSSLLHCLAGLEPRMRGTVSIGGQALSDLARTDRARLIGFLPQRAEVHWNMSVRALVGLGRIAHGEPEPDRGVVDDAIADMDIGHLADRPMLTLSGGEQARVLLARVLAGEPDWLLADEPLASLDPAHQIAVLDRLRALAATGVGVVAVLHDINHASRVADHVLVMKDGKIHVEGRPVDVLRPDIMEQLFAVRFRRISDDPVVLIPA